MKAPTAETFHSYPAVEQASAALSYENDVSARDGQVLDHPGARVTALSEHHATITGFDAPRGTRVRVVPNHVCNAVNLADEYVVVVDGTWRVDARGEHLGPGPTTSVRGVDGTVRDGAGS